MLTTITEAQDTMDAAAHIIQDKLIWNDINATQPLELAVFRSILKHGASHLITVEKFMASSNSTTLGFLEVLEEILKMTKNCVDCRGSFRDIRRLAILRRPSEPVVEPVATTPGMDQAFYTLDYTGNAQKALYEYLTYMNKAFVSGTTDLGQIIVYYAKYCAIIQSSGTGKTRLQIELGKLAYLLYMNLRPQDDIHSYPLRDNIPAKMLDPETVPTIEAYEARCCAFFAAVFFVVDNELSRHDPYTRTLDSHLAWDQKFGLFPQNQRANLFEKLKTEFDRCLQAINELDPVTMDTSEDPAPASGDRTEDNDDVTMTEAGKTISASSSGNVLCPEPFVKGKSVMTAALSKLQSHHPVLFSETIHDPQLIIALDEVAHLGKVVNYGGVSWKPADVLCRTISAYSNFIKLPIWVTFTSTESHIADFAAPNITHSSQRLFVGGQSIIPPVCETGFDQFAPKLDQVDLLKIADANHIVLFGRPLWYAAWKTYCSSVGQLTDMATMKLLQAPAFDNTRSSQALAVLAQRFCIDVTFHHPKAAKFLDKAVASHMRFCISISEDRQWKFTAYPSEPILSHCAAEVMWTSPSVMEKIFVRLDEKLRSGMIDKGKQGELITRILTSFAKDLCIMDLPVPPPPSDHFKHCQSVRVVDWLEKLFGPKFWPADESQCTLAKTAFEGAKINFTHWIGMTGHIAGGKNVPKNTFNAEDWVKRHYVRTSAVQCSHNQPDIDKMIPFHTPGGFSHIYISDKLRKVASPQDVKQIKRSNPSIRTENGRAWIAVTMDLGVEDVGRHRVNTTYSKADKCLRIHAIGMSHETFPFLTDDNGFPLERVMKDLLVCSTESPGRFPGLDMLREQARFGATTKDINMKWEEQRSDAYLNTT